MKKKVKLLNLVICALTFMATLVMIFGITSVGYGGGVIMAGATLGYTAIHPEATLPPDYWFNSIWNLTLTLIFYGNIGLLEKSEKL